MAKKRIHQIAKELDLASADILHQAKELGIEVKTASSGLTEEEEELVKLALAPVEGEKVSVEEEKVSVEEVEQNDNESQEEIVELQEEEAVAVRVHHVLVPGGQAARHEDARGVHAGRPPGHRARGAQQKAARQDNGVVQRRPRSDSRGAHRRRRGPGRSAGRPGRGVPSVGHAV